MPINRKCPDGSYGKWPDCYTPGGNDGNTTPGTNNRKPNTDCPEGNEYSKLVKTCVKKNQKRKQQEQPQQQKPLLQAPTYKIDPNLLQQQ